MGNIKIQLKAPFIVALAFILLFPNFGRAAGITKYMKNLRGETVALPPSVPEKEGLVLVSFLTLANGSDEIGAMAIYDNPKTATEADYIELYDQTGGLLSVTWLDPFGIRRTAMDFGLLKEDASALEGVLVLLVDGVPL